MMLTELAEVPTEVLPVAGLQEHLRLGSGFAMAPGQDALLVSHLRAALAMIEGRTAKALLQRRFRLQLSAWLTDDAQPLPLAPVAAVSTLVLLDAGGGQQLVPATRYRLRPDAHRPRIEGAGGRLPAIPTDGSAVIEFDAGFGAQWADLPADLQQAVLLLAAEFYERRHHDPAGPSGLPPAVMALIERWRLIRSLGRSAR